MRKVITFLLVICMLASISVSSGIFLNSSEALAADLNFNPIDDTFVQSNDDSGAPPDHSGENILRVRNNTTKWGFIAEAFLKFDVAGLGNDDIVQDAKITFLCTYKNSDAKGKTYLYGLDNSWSGETMSWAGRPTEGTLVAAVDNSLISQNQYITFDVSSYITGNGTYSFRITTESKVGIIFASSQHETASWRPVLDINISGEETPGSSPTPSPSQTPSPSLPPIPSLSPSPSPSTSHSPSSIPKPLPAGIPADNKYARLGYLDVTLYGADPTGSADSTSQIQKAIDDAYKNQMVVFFPTGTYLVSDTLKMMRIKDSDSFRTRKGHVLEGSTVGPRPVIKLQDNSPGFQDPSKEQTNEANPTTTKAVVHFWTAKNESDPNPEKEDGANDYNQVFRGIDIDIGSGNPGAVGIRHKGAEGTSIQDVKITAAKAFAGIYSLLGSGGSITNVEIIGGKYGIYATQVQPMPVITGIKMSEQEDKAIYYRGLTPLTIVGFDIQKSKGPVANIFKDKGSVESWGNLALIDGKILLTDGDGTDVMIQNTDRLVYLKNVYVKNAGKIVTNSFDDTSLTVDNPAVWNKVEEYAYSKNDYPDKTKIINGVRTSETQVSLVNGSEEPPSDLVSRHVWDKNYWTFEDPDVINVEDYGAKGDGVTDDTQAIRAAIAASEGHGDKVFIPRGRYKVSGTIKLLENTKLFGIARYLTSLEPIGWSEKVSTPIIESADSKTSTNVLANLKIELYRTSDNIYAIKWMAGRNSIESCVWICWDFDNASTSSNVIQRVIITGNGGGRWYNHTSEIGFNTEAKGNRSVLVDGTTEPLTFYMFHNQHIKSDTISEVRNASNVTFYGVKTETQTTADPNRKDDPTSPWPLSLVISNSSNIGIYGYSGLGQAWKGRGLFEINDSKNVSVVNMARWGPVQYTPDLWYYVKVTNDGVTKGIHADTPVNLVKIGTETWIEDHTE